MRILFALTILIATSGACAASEAAWQALQEGGVVALIRHARAPGVGDPAGFRLNECATQRNLSEAGRAQARALGAEFNARKIDVRRVLSSRWCRALDTARLAFGDLAQPAPALNSIFPDQDAREAQTRAFRDLVEGWHGREGVAVFVTHQVNITALTGAFLAEGEVLVLKPRPEGFTLFGRIAAQP
jgi:broad specificity phosphatase PhoE